MNFCRNCGSRMAGQAAPVAAPNPMPTPAAGYPPPASVRQPGAPPQRPVGAPFASAPQQRPIGAPGAGQRPIGAPGSGSPLQRPIGAPSTASPATASMQTCPHCHGQTPMGFAFCQQCGQKLGGAPASSSGRVDAVAPTLAASLPAEVNAGLQAQPAADTLASQQHERAPTPRPFAVNVPAWGALVSLERDGSDGTRHPLTGEWVEIGREFCDIHFPNDRFLAHKHARIERTDGGGRLILLDGLNGVFRRVFDPVPLNDGDVLLLGREVVRIEFVDEDERAAVPLVRHGVALFGSPLREPWARLSQLLASGGVRDIRHLFTQEVTIGREEGDIVHHDDAFLSRQHASLRWHDGVCTLTDLDSSNGTFVRLTEDTMLQTGDQLRMGDQVFRFEFLV